MIKFLFLPFFLLFTVRGFTQLSEIKGKVENRLSQEKLGGAFVSCMGNGDGRRFPFCFRLIKKLPFVSVTVPVMIFRLALSIRLIAAYSMGCCDTESVTQPVNFPDWANKFRPNIKNMGKEAARLVVHLNS